MKHKIKVLFGVALIMPLFSIAPVFAHAGHYHSEPQVAATTDEKSTIESRLTERKSKYQERLTAAQQTLIKTRCKSISSVIARLRTRVTAFEAQRPHLYENVANKLGALGPKLQAAGIDVTEYNKQVAELKKLVEAFDGDAAALKTALDDLATMDCTADPEGFAVTVKDAVALRQSTIEKGQAVRAYMKQTVRPTLVSVRAQLHAKKEDEN